MQLTDKERLHVSARIARVTGLLVESLCADDDVYLRMRLRDCARALEEIVLYELPEKREKGE